MDANEQNRALHSCSAIAGSVSVLAAGLISLPIPSPWFAVVWVVLAIVFCTGSGWLLGYLISNAEDER